MSDNTAPTSPGPVRGGIDGVEMVVFDCDGVLIDSETIYVDAELRFLARAGVRYDRATYIRTYMGLSPGEWRERLSVHVPERTGRPLPGDFFDALDAFVVEAFESALVAVPGVRGAVADLYAARCVASSTPLQRLSWKLEHTGLLDLFAPNIFSAEMVERGKPQPDLFLHAARTMGVDPGRCVVVEDSANGVRAGKAAGMAVIGFAGGGHCLDGHGAMLTASGADTVIDTFADLQAALLDVVR
jgi:HAD superfamily hydrolase (TIGR01509 family)